MVMIQLLNYWRDQSTLFNYIKYREYDEALKHANNKRQAMFQDEKGYTPMHMACLNGAPLNLVEALLQVFPQAAILNNQYGSLPIHLCCKCVDQNSVSVLRALLSEYPSTAFEFKKDENLTTFQILVRWNEADIYHALSTPQNVVRRFAWDPQLRIFWSKACILIKACFGITKGGPVQDEDLETNLLHMFVEGSSRQDMRCPQCLIHLATIISPHQLQERDKFGNLPLHIAAQNSVRILRQTGCQSTNDLEISITTTSFKDIEIIAFLAKLHPGAKEVYNKNGELPIHMALNAIKEIQFYKTSQQTMFPIIWERIVLPLIPLNCDEVFATGAQKGLLPFMLCCSFPFDGHSPAPSTLLLQLNLSFSLLRHYPHVLERFINISESLQTSEHLLA